VNGLDFVISGIATNASERHTSSMKDLEFHSRSTECSGFCIGQFVFDDSYNNFIYKIDRAFVLNPRFVKAKRIG
jgi:hypothetical protein